MSSPTPHDNGVGRVIDGRYELVERIGEGGTGTIWRALDRVLDRTVAVKEIFPPELFGEELHVFFERFRREARTTARLMHPNVVTLHDVLEEGGRPWIVMELVAGRSLQEIINSEGPIPPRRAAAIGSQVLSGLSAAHAAGILHRDVKPSNILITEHGQAMLTDFGIALVEGDTTLTRPGTVIGTVSYMPPERLTGQPETPASDLWSLGATLYAAVEGKAPYERSSAEATIFAQLSGELQPPVHAEDLTPVLTGLLKRDPAQRMDASQATLLLGQIAGQRSADGAAGPAPAPAPPPPMSAVRVPHPPPSYPMSPPQGSAPPSPDYQSTYVYPLGRPRRPGRLKRLSAWFGGRVSIRFRPRGPSPPKGPPSVVDDVPAWTGAIDGDGAPSSALYTPLHEQFRYIHEPLPIDEAAIPLLGNEQLIRALKQRLVNSRGGTFLITGFRGVGKTTLVERALAELAAEPSPGRRVLPVVLSVARPMQTDKLLFAIVRRIFEELTEAGVLEALPAATRQSLLLAYMRTSLAFKETRSDAWERASNVDVDPAKVIGGPLKPISLAIPKAGVSTKRSRSLATEAAFLAYSETDVEHDMMRIIRMLSSPAARRGRGWRRLLWWRHRPPVELQLVVVLDEVDKLTAVKEDLAEVERLLSGIKNVVTMRGAHYLMVAGPDLYDQALKDSGRGNSIYESIFAWRLYVPCNWSAPGRLLETLFLNRVDQSSGGIISEFEQYLRFKSRGVLRRLLHELNSFVVWEDTGKPYLRIDSTSHDAISLYAQIERALDAFFVATRGQVLPNPLSQDRWRLSGYHVMDWILRTERRPFTSADVIRSVDDKEIDPLLRVTQTGVDMLLEHLSGQQILDVVRTSPQPTSRVIADVSDAQLPSYKLTDGLLARLLGIAVQSEEERAELDYTRTRLAMRISREQVPIETIANRYELLRLIGEGGTSSVYEGRDTLLRRPVAVKMLSSALSGDPVARRRFLREARIAEGVHHPNVVDVYEVVALGETPESADRQFAIVMELFTAPTLRAKLRDGGPLPAREVALTGITLAGALDYLADKGLARLDLKPNNIVMTPDRGPVIIDLGIAKIVKDSHVWLVESDDTPERNDPATQAGIMIGTPAYLAPEQFRGGDEVDIRADIYALGLVLYTCLAGRHPYEGQPMVAIMAGTMMNDLDTSELSCSPELRQVITRATARDLMERFQRPADLLAALRDTPEAQDHHPEPRLSSSA